MDLKIVKITYSAETPDQSLLWLQQIIINLLIKELNLNPEYSGNLISTFYKDLYLNDKYERQDF